MEKVKTVLLKVPPVNVLVFFSVLFVLVCFFAQLVSVGRLIFALVIIVTVAWAVEMYTSYNYQYNTPVTLAPVVVTGASRGIGKHIALHLQRIGYDVFAGVRRVEDGKKLEQEASTTGGKLIPIILDISDPKSVKDAKELVESYVGETGILALINNAAALPAVNPFYFSNDQEWRQCFDVNVFGTVNVTKTFLPLLHKYSGSRIIFISSEVYHYPSTLMSAYVASKYAIEELATSLRAELFETGIHVCVVRPGVTHSDMLESTVNVSMPDLQLTQQAKVVPGKVVEQYKIQQKEFSKLQDVLYQQASQPQILLPLVEHAVRSKHPRAEYNILRNSPLSLLSLTPPSFLSTLLDTVS